MVLGVWASSHFPPKPGGLTLHLPSTAGSPTVLASQTVRWITSLPAPRLSTAAGRAKLNDQFHMGSLVGLWWTSGVRRICRPKRSWQKVACRSVEGATPPVEGGAVLLRPQSSTMRSSPPGPPVWCRQIERRGKRSSSTVGLQVEHNQQHALIICLTSCQPTHAATQHPRTRLACRLVYIRCTSKNPRRGSTSRRRMTPASWSRSAPTMPGSSEANRDTPSGRAATSSSGSAAKD
jgi:hypothetical protein